MYTTAEANCLFSLQTNQHDQNQPKQMYVFSGEIFISSHVLYMQNTDIRDGKTTKYSNSV